MTVPPGKRASTGENHSSVADRVPSALRLSAPSRMWLSLGAALFILNFSLTFHNVWPTLPRMKSVYQMESSSLSIIMRLGRASGHGGA